MLRRPKDVERSPVFASDSGAFERRRMEGGIVTPNGETRPTRARSPEFDVALLHANETGVLAVMSETRKLRERGVA
jgi:hypothetical protein